MPSAWNTVAARSSGLTGCSAADPKQSVVAAPPPQAPNLSSNLEVVKNSKGPVMTTIEEFYKVGPGPSSSHTIGPMRITYGRQVCKAQRPLCEQCVVQQWCVYYQEVVSKAGN